MLLSTTPVQQKLEKNNLQMYILSLFKLVLLSAVWGQGY